MSCSLGLALRLWQYCFCRILLYQLLPPTGNTRGPSALDSLLRTLTEELGPRETVTFQLRGDSGHAGLAIDVPPQHRTWLWNELLDAYPGTKLERIDDQPPDNAVTAFLTLTPDYFSLRTTTDFRDQFARQTDDPIGGLLSRLKTGRNGRLAVRISLEVTRPQPKQLERFGKQAHLIATITDTTKRRRIANRLTQAGPIRRWLIERSLQRAASKNSPQEEELKSDQPLLACRLRIELQHPPSVRDAAQQKLATIVAAFARFNTPDCRFVASAKPHRKPFLLTPAEIASLWHVPTATTDSVSRVNRNTFHELPPPTNLPTRREPGDIILGRVVYRGQRDPVILKEDDLRRHLFILGRTGSGKSVLLGNIARQRINDGRGTIVIDPHGELVESIRRSIKGRRKNDIIYLDAANLSGKVFYNPLIGPPTADAGLIADGVLTVFQQTFGLDAATAPRLLHILRTSLLTLIGQPGVTLASINRLLTDDLFRKSMIGRCSNQAVVSFWQDEFDRWPRRERPLIIASLQNKLGPFTTSERLQHILCTPTSKAINLRDIMDKQRVLLVNLSKGQTGQDTSKLLGSLLLCGLHLAAMSRANVPEEDRPDATVIVDEIASYLSDENTTIAESLAELRKYRVSYILASQLLIGQLDEATRTAVLGNIGSLVAMTIGPTDAELVASLMGESVASLHLIATPRFHAYARLLLNGTSIATTFSTDHHC